MADTASVRIIASALADHKGDDVVILDLSALAGWTDSFIIATATSSVHLRGLERVVLEEAAKLGLSPLRKSSRAEDDEWLLVDLGDIVVHLMTARARSFYELERLWFQAGVERVGPGGLPKP